MEPTGILQLPLFTVCLPHWFSVHWSSLCSLHLWSPEQCLAHRSPQKPVEPVNEPPEFQVLLSGCTRFPAQVCLTSKSQLIITMLFCFCYDCRQNVTRTCRGIPFWSCRENGKQARKVTLRDWLGWGAGMDTSK